MLSLLASRIEGRLALVASLPSPSLHFVLTCFVTVLAMSTTADLGQPIASTSTAGSTDEKQIAIRLSTKDAAYTIPPAKFLVPASWRRFHLSELINKVLENGTHSFPSFFGCGPSLLPLFSLSRSCGELGCRERGWHRMIQLYDIGILRSDVFEVSRTMSNSFLHFLMPSLARTITVLPLQS